MEWDSLVRNLVQSLVAINNHAHLNAIQSSEGPLNAPEHKYPFSEEI